MKVQMYSPRAWRESLHLIVSNSIDDDNENEYDIDYEYEYDIGPPGGQGKLHKKIEDLLDGHLKKMYVDEKGV